jgi:hypothetical protein
MQMTQRVGWMLVGVVIGAVTVGSVVNGQPGRERPGPKRLQFITADFYENHNFAFVKDPTSGGCWLLAKGSEGSPNNAVSLAPAPVSACEPR